MFFRATLLICSLCILIFSSCTVEKRRHLNGYHISWGHPVKKAKTVKVEKKKAEQFQFTKTNNSESSLSKEKTDNSQVSLEKSDDLLKLKKPSSDLKAEIINEVDEKEKLIEEQAVESDAEEKKSKEDKGTRDQHPNTVMGIFSGALSIPAVIGMIAAFAGGHLSVILGILLFLIWVFLVIFGFKFSIDALTNTLDHPEEYKGLMWVILGIAISVTSVIVFLIFIGLL